jgi:hypothetical protein
MTHRGPVPLRYLCAGEHKRDRAGRFAPNGTSYQWRRVLYVLQEESSLCAVATLLAAAQTAKSSSPKLM